MPVITTKNSFFHSDYVIGGQIIDTEGKKYLEIFLSTGEKTVFELPYDIDDSVAITMVASTIFSDEDTVNFDDIIKTVHEGEEQIKDELKKQKLIEKIIEMPLSELKERKIKELIE